MGGKEFATLHVVVVVLSLAIAGSTADDITSFAFSPSTLNFTESLILCTSNSQIMPPNSKSIVLCLTPPGVEVGLSVAVGRCMYSKPINFSDGSSFSTAFSFNYLTDPQPPGEGFVFIISADGSYAPQPLSEGHEFMGWLNSSTNGKSTGLNFGVEFDLKETPAFNDPKNAHVGINLDSMTSLETTESSIISTTSTLVLTYAWIDYDHSRLEVEVRVSSDGKRPCQPTLSHTVNLSKLLSQPRYVGFGASTGPSSSSLSQPSIYDWSFSSGVMWNDSVYGQSSCGGSKTSVWKWAVIVVGVLFPLVVFLGPVLWIRRRWRQTSTNSRGIVLVVIRSTSDLEAERRTAENDIPSNSDFHDSEVKLSSEIYGPRIFKSEELFEACNNFSDENIIGKGAFGDVYKGIFPKQTENGSSSTQDSMIAVKSIKEDNRDGRKDHSRKEFQAEVQAIGAVRHANLVRLLGWCCEGGKYLIVYEYMPNGDLHDFLHRKPRHPGLPPREAKWPVPWHMRMKMVKGLAAALTLLHEGVSGKRMVHRDVKSSNVLLDKDYNARLSDFGLARFYPLDESALRTQPAGTWAYMAPECKLSGTFTEKSDVYSFAVLMMEVASGLKPKWIDGGLPFWVATLYHEGKLLEAADPNLDLPGCGGYPAEEMTMMLTVALACCHFDPVRRPTMRHVQSYLDGIIPLDTLHPLPVVSELGGIDASSSQAVGRITTASGPPLPLSDASSSEDSPQRVGCVKVPSPSHWHSDKKEVVAGHAPPNVTI